MFLLLIPVAMTCIIILLIFKRIKLRNRGLPCGPVSKESACNAENPGLILGSGRSCGGRNGNPLQSSCLGDPMDRGAWWATVHGVTTAGHNLATKRRQSWKIRKMEIVGSDCMVKEQIKTHPSCPFQTTAPCASELPWGYMSYIQVCYCPKWFLYCLD